MERPRQRRAKEARQRGDREDNVERDLDGPEKEKGEEMDITPGEKEGSESTVNEPNQIKRQSLINLNFTV